MMIWAWCFAGAVFALHIPTMQWTQPQTDIRALMRARVPHALVGHSAVAVGNRIYVFGGKVIGGEALL